MATNYIKFTEVQLILPACFQKIDNHPMTAMHLYLAPHINTEKVIKLVNNMI